MPVNRGSSNKAREENIKAEIHAGKPIKQAVAIGYSEQRQAMKKHHGHHGTSHHSPPHGEHYKHPMHGAPGSHEETHKSIDGARSRIHEGLPSELESYHGTDGDGYTHK
jgi:hypothetical protein